MTAPRRDGVRDPVHGAPGVHGSLADEEARVGSLRDHVVQCGMHGLGLRVIEQLREADLEVVVIEDAPTERDRRVADRLGVVLLAGDATTSEALERAGAARARAVICAEGDDLRSLQTALLARDGHPDLRVVTRLGNAAVGRAVARDDGPGAVVDVASIAAPAIAQACRSSPVQEIDVAGRRFLAATTTAPRGATLRALYGDLAPLACGDPRRPVICPGRDHRVEAGEEVSLLGTPEQLLAAGVTTAAPEPGERRVTRRGAGRDAVAGRPGRRRSRRALATLRQVAREADRGLRWALVALLGLLVVSTVVLSLGYDDPGMGVVDALYFTVESVATVGFGDYSFAEQPLWLRLWAIFLMLAGVATTAVPLAFLTDLLISRRLATTAGRRRAAGATDHVVVIGLGTIGLAVVEQLRGRGYDVVVVEDDPANRFLERARALDVPVVLGDATGAEVLTAARVPRAAAVAVLTSDDMVNIETGLAVRDVLAGGPDPPRPSRDGAAADPAAGAGEPGAPVVLRLFDRELARTAGQRFAFRSVHAVAELVAPRFVGAALGLDVLGSFPVHRRTFLLGRLRVRAGSGLDGLAMQELSARTRVVALRRAPRPGGPPEGVLEHPPRRDTRFERGDEAYLVGPYPELLEVLRRQDGAASRDR